MRDMAVWGEGAWLNSGGRGDMGVKRGGYMAERLRERLRWLYEGGIGMAELGRGILRVWVRPEGNG